VHLNVVTTLRCNLRCAHCIYACPAEGDLDPEGFARVLWTLAPRGLGSLMFTGGEPGLHPAFGKLVDGAVEWGLLFGVTSNGWTLTPYLDAVHRHRELFTGFHLSLDGLEETHDDLRGAGSFARVMRSMAECRAHGLPVRVNFVLSDRNASELEEVVALCAREKVEAIKLAGLLPSPGAPDLRLSRETRLAAAGEAPELARRHGAPIEVASSLLTEPVVLFCGVMTSTTLTLNERCEVTWCCDVPGSASALATCDEGADAILSRRARARDEMTLDRILKVQGGELAVEDRTCAYCHRFFAAAVEHVGA